MMESKEKRKFTQDELEKYDGKEGRPQYLVFRGQVYDLTNSALWKEGLHFGGIHTLKEDLTETIKDAPHGDEVLSKFPVIGEFTPAGAPAPPQKLSPARARIPLKVPEEEAQPVLERRDFLKLALVAGGGATAFALGTVFRSIFVFPLPTVALVWPKVKVANIKNLQPMVPVTFYYPLQNTPNFLVKFDSSFKPDFGIGPDKDIVAFSGICQHLGCYYGFLSPGSSPPCNSNFKASTPQGYCCCHGSQYDFLHNAQVISGPAPRAVPRVDLIYDDATGDISAVSMQPPTIFGHGPPGTTDPALVLKYDLQGGQVVTS